ncbi:CopG family transcriptional regulator [Sinorhizobium meliloti CCBAU 01290]|nr:CopG family transcriptional regulator [Sinorhizobium meliloti CCBAU 01290]
MTAFTVRVSDETASKLEQIAEKLDRSRSYMAAQAIEDYVAREEWQLAESRPDWRRPIEAIR